MPRPRQPGGAARGDVSRQAADRVLAVDGCSTATVQELHLVALHVVCAAVDVALGVCPSETDLRQREVVA